MLRRYLVPPVYHFLLVLIRSPYSFSISTFLFDALLTSAYTALSREYWLSDTIQATSDLSWSMTQAAWNLEHFGAQNLARSLTRGECVAKFQIQVIEEKSFKKRCILL